MRYLVTAYWESRWSGPWSSNGSYDSYGVYADNTLIACVILLDNWSTTPTWEDSLVIVEAVRAVESNETGIIDNTKEVTNFSAYADGG